MRAAVLDSWGGQLAVVERPDPEPGPGEALVRVVSCGAGLTLESARSGDMGGSVPRVLGHEYAGRVESLGPGASRVEPGQHVTGSFYLFCGSCEMCTSGRETLCLDMAGFIGVASDGAFADYLVVPARNLVGIPDGVSLVEAGVVADAVATTYHAAGERARLRPDQRAAVIGAGGGLGVHMLAMAKAFGAATIAVESDQAKLERLRSLGTADAVVDAGEEEWPVALAEAASGRLDACFDFVCSEATMQGSLSALGPGGALVLAGFRPGSLRVVPPPFILKELAVTSTRYASRAEIERSLALVARGAVETVIGATFPLAEVEAAFEAIRRNEVFGRVVVDVALDDQPVTAGSRQVSGQAAGA